MDKAGRNGATTAAVLIPLIPAALFYVLTLPGLAELYQTPFGNGGGESRLAEGLLQLWLIGTGGLLWVMLGVQLWVGRNASGVPAWGRTAILPLYLLSGLAAVFAVATMTNYVGGWSGMVPVLLPPLIALYATWAGLERLHRRPRPEMACGLLLAPVVLLIVATVPLGLLDQVRAPVNAARLEAQRDVAEGEKMAEFQREADEAHARYQKLTADSPLRDYLRYASYGDEEDMIARMRLVKSRQRDAAVLLNEGRILRLSFFVAARPRRDARALRRLR